MYCCASWDLEYFVESGDSFGTAGPAFQPFMKDRRCWMIKAGFWAVICICVLLSTSIASAFALYGGVLR